MINSTGSKDQDMRDYQKEEDEQDMLGAEVTNESIYHRYAHEFVQCSLPVHFMKKA